ncbi:MULTISPECIES: alanine dehydrogenase [unclassified Spirosoma]|uniref:alanine dehydrogenase n=1 Tax=unclassified Spirosoma TaxID=2621999 RepID=UPI0009612F01|nr:MULTISPECIES: alanine dehydrogenase [unclassified Spirosoma]MBN8823667.1 alanine dehydrogenase [Spirosoma sp.]OJW76782.1 MAG: alanine dehydrogenase [Spirosoma sp. 48-14]
MTGFEELAKQTALYPKEALQAVKTNRNGLLIGLPKEVSLQENRIALTPEAVAILVRHGHNVIVEQGAGEKANFSDTEYSEAGAQIAQSPKEVYTANLILKVEPLIDGEFEFIQSGSTVISALNLPAHDRSYFEKINEKNLTAFGYEYIEDQSGGLPVIRSMSEIAGSTVMLIAGEYLSNAANGRGIILGGITGVPPTKVVMLGAGTVTEYAIRMALGMGAEVKVFDKYLYKLQRLKYAVGQHVYTSIIASDTLAEAVQRADVVIGAMRAEDGLSPVVVTEEMVGRMKPGSVIIDVSIDQGGNFETSRMTTHKNPTYKHMGVIHYCVPNIAARVAHTASMALSNIFLPFLLETGTTGGIEQMMYANRWFMKGVYTHKGTLTNAYIARKFNMRFKDLDLLLAARF